MPTPTAGEVRVGVDVGGTFTDVLAFDPDHDTVWIEKVPSTSPNPCEGVIDGFDALVDRAGIDPGDVTTFAHGTTVAVNALIERGGARTGLLVTDGFSGVPLARHGEKPPDEVKNPRFRQPATYVPQERVYGVPERVGSDGEVVESLDEATTREAIESLRDDDVESIAVCLLFSFLRPEHERRVAEIVADVHPDCSVTLSSDVAPRIREFPRLSTTVISAYVTPVLTDYLADLERRLDERGVDPEALLAMLSHGGLTTFAEAASTTAGIVLSGPAAGVRGALFTAESVGEENVVTMDMGGTSCDVAIAPDGEPVTTIEKSFDQHPVSVPMIDVQTIGAGGGTIASVRGGRLRVGPDSAGADPGPVCYGRGGRAVTVTDANAVVGRLGPDATLAGGLSIDREAAIDAVRQQIADPLDLSVTEAATGILAIVNDEMKKELSLALTREGVDPRAFSLVVYGGAGPMHATPIARELDLDRVIVPPHPGINSAVGLLTTHRSRLFERSRVDPVPDAPIDEVFGELEAEARGEHESAGRCPDSVTVEGALELRYAGEPYELTLVDLEDSSPESLQEAFDERHREVYGHVSEKPVETMTYRVVSTVEMETLDAEALVAADDGLGDHGARTTRDVYFDGAYRSTSVYDRRSLDPSSVVEGPAIVEQTDATVVVDPDATARVGPHGSLVITQGSL